MRARGRYFCMRFLGYLRFAICDLRFCRTSPFPWPAHSGKLAIGNRQSKILLSSFIAMALMLSVARAAEEPKQTLFLPKSPRAAAYVLGRLSNKELMAAPRSEFVY